MTHRLLLPLLATTLLLNTGCGMFSKKSSRPKENPLIAGEVEETFRRRWLEKRTAELAAQGTEATTARAKAEAEFGERYAFPTRKK